MNTADWIALAAIVGIAALSYYYRRKKLKKGCGGSCSSCSQYGCCIFRERDKI